VRAAVFDTFVRWGIGGRSRTRRDRGDAHQVRHGDLRTPPAILVDFLKTWDQMAAEESAKNPFFQEGVRVAARICREGVPAKRFMFPPYSFAGELLLPEKPAAKSEAKTK